MKRFVLLLAVICLFVSTTSYAAYVPSAQATDIKNQEQLLKAISKMSVEEFEEFSGKKLTGLGKMAFNATKKQVLKHTNADGSFTKKFERKLNRFRDAEDGGFHFGGLALGFFLGLIGVVLAYVAGDEAKKPGRVKWAWIGFGIAVLLTIVLVAVVLKDSGL